MDVINALDLAGTFVFAVSGALTAGEKKFDIFGAATIALATAVGGGTLRDLLIGASPVGWMTNHNYLLLILLAVPAAWLFRKYFLRLRRTMFLFDTIGIGLFTILGVDKNTHGRSFASCGGDDGHGIGSLWRRVARHSLQRGSTDFSKGNIRHSVYRRCCAVSYTRLGRCWLRCRCSADCSSYHRHSDSGGDKKMATARDKLDGWCPDSWASFFSLPPTAEVGPAFPQWPGVFMSSGHYKQL